MSRPMSTQSDQKADSVKLQSTKAAYSKAAHKKLMETRTKLAGVSAKIRNAVATGRIDSTDQLRRAQHAVDLNLATAEARIEQLRKSAGDNWEDLARDVDTAWEDLSQSVKMLVARFSDQSK